MWREYLRFHAALLEELYEGDPNDTGNVRINVTLRRVRATTVAVEKQYYIGLFWVTECSHSYPVCNALAPYCHLWPVRLYSIFAHYVINGRILENSYWTQNVCFDFLHNICMKRFFILRRTEQDQKCILVFMWSTSYSCQTLMVFEFSWHNSV